jgi:hypothetical protein
MTEQFYIVIKNNEVIKYVGTDKSINEYSHLLIQFMSKN